MPSLPKIPAFGIPRMVRFYQAVPDSMLMSVSLKAGGSRIWLMDCFALDSNHGRKAYQSKTTHSQDTKGEGIGRTGPPVPSGAHLQWPQPLHQTLPLIFLLLQVMPKGNQTFKTGTFGRHLRPTLWNILLEKWKKKKKCSVLFVCLLFYWGRVSI